MREPTDHHITNNTTYHEPITALPGVIPCTVNSALPGAGSSTLKHLCSYTEAGEEKTES